MILLEQGISKSIPFYLTIPSTHANLQIELENKVTKIKSVFTLEDVSTTSVYQLFLFSGTIVNINAGEYNYKITAYTLTPDETIVLEIGLLKVLTACTEEDIAYDTGVDGAVYYECND